MNKSNEINLTEGGILKPLLQLFLPIALGIFFQQLYNTCDAVIVGKFVGKEALAAVGGPTSSIVNLLVGFFTGISSGAAVLVSHLYGAENHEGMSKAVHTAITLAISAGLALTIFILVFAENILKLMSTPDDIMDYSMQYLRIYSIGMIPSLVYNMASAILRATGDTKHPLYYLIITCIINVMLDLLFIVVLKTEVAGAAFATLIAQTISAVVVLVFLHSSHSPCLFTPKRLGFTTAMLKKMVYIGVPAGLQSVMYSASNIVVQSSINFFGTDAIAAWAAYGKIDAFLWMAVNSLGVATMTFVGQNYGAGKKDRIFKCVRVSLCLICLIPLTIGGLMLIFGKPLLELFNSDSNVIGIGLDMMHFILPFYITYVSIEVFSATMRGVGTAVVPTILTCVGVCLLRIVWLIFAVPVHHTLYMVLMCYPITWITTTILFVIYYFKGKWLDMPDI